MAASVGLAAVPSRAQVALVIGNSAYAALPRLPTCDMSANLATAALTRAGFRVSQQLNPSNARMGAAIASLGDDLAASPGTPAVIYLCGYVAAYADRLFLLPVESKLERDTDVLTQGIVARLLMSSAMAAPGGAALVLMDVAPRPGTDTAAAVGAMVRPTDLAHVGFAAAQIAPAGDQIAAPLATALADMLHGGAVELGAALAQLPANPILAKARLLTVRPPTSASWLVGKPPSPATSASVAPAVMPALAAVRPLAEPNPADRRRLQVALQRLGYFQGRVTGRFGPDTEAAIRLMQRESGVEATGRLTVDQAALLLDH